MVMGTICDVLQDALNKTIRKQPEMNERIFTLCFASIGPPRLNGTLLSRAVKPANVGSRFSCVSLVLLKNQKRCRLTGMKLNEKRGFKVVQINWYLTDLEISDNID